MSIRHQTQALRFLLHLSTVKRTSHKFPQQLEVTNSQLQAATKHLKFANNFSASQCLLGFISRSGYQCHTVVHIYCRIFHHVVQMWKTFD